MISDCLIYLRKKETEETKKKMKQCDEWKTQLALKSKDSQARGCSKLQTVGVCSRPGQCSWPGLSRRTEWRTVLGHIKYRLRYQKRRQQSRASSSPESFRGCLLGSAGIRKQEWKKSSAWETSKIRLSDNIQYPKSLQERAGCLFSPSTASCSTLGTTSFWEGV